MEPFQVRQQSISPGVDQYHLAGPAGPLTYASVLNSLASEQHFRTAFSDLLRNSPYAAYRWETPAIDTELVERPFEFVLYDAPSLNVPADLHTFREAFTNADADGVSVFDNLGGDATLVVPAPLRGEDRFAHLAAFIRTGQADQVDALWKRVALAAQSRLSVRPLWLSTAGGGVAWLHVRLDARPKYYGHAPYRRAASG